MKSTITGPLTKVQKDFEKIGSTPHQSTYVSQSIFYKKYYYKSIHVVKITNEYVKKINSSTSIPAFQHMNDFNSRTQVGISRFWYFSLSGNSSNTWCAIVSVIFGIFNCVFCMSISHNCTNGMLLL